MAAQLAVQMSADDINAFLDREFPQIHLMGRVFEVVDVRLGEACLRLTPNEQHVRPGGTISGPTLFSLADLGAYVVLLAHIGPVALAVTTNLNINFLRKPEVRPLIGRCRLIKLGRQLAVVDIGISHLGETDLVAQASATYAIPPNR